MLIEGLNSMIENKRITDLYILARYFYRIGQPIMDDCLYDKMEQTLRCKRPADAVEFLERCYDDDPIPEALLTEVGIKPAAFLKRSDYGDLTAILDDDKSLSMFSVTSAEDAYEFFMNLRSNRLDFVASLKVDGVNTKMMYAAGELCLSLSRGRNEGTGFDYMEGTSKVMPLRVENFSQVPYLKITGESYVEKEALPFFREKYDAGKYKTSKSSAISMLRTKHDCADYRYLHTLVFHADTQASTVADMLDTLKREGFETVPYILHSWAEIPDGRKEFKEWLERQVMQPVWDAGIGIPSDGCAIEVNDFGWAGDMCGQYSTRQIALKFAQWKFKIYQGEVTDIRLEQRRVYKSVRIEIKPIVTDDDCRAEVINSFNPAILIENGLVKGSHVYFEKNADAVNILIHGKRLKEITNESDD